MRKLGKKKWEIRGKINCYNNCFYDCYWQEKKTRLIRKSFFNKKYDRLIVKIIVQSCKHFDNFIDKFRNIPSEHFVKSIKIKKRNSFETRIEMV